jgi:hypothetical protein
MSKSEIQRRLKSYGPVWKDGALLVPMTVSDSFMEHQKEFLESKGYRFAGAFPEHSGVSTADYVLKFERSGGMGGGFL